MFFSGQPAYCELLREKKKIGQDIISAHAENIICTYAQTAYTKFIKKNSQNKDEMPVQHAQQQSTVLLFKLKVFFHLPI